jgi:hypothetical protein
MSHDKSLNAGISLSPIIVLGFFRFGPWLANAFPAFRAAGGYQESSDITVPSSRRSLIFAREYCALS